MNERLLEVDRVSKQYRLGMINGGMLYRDINSWIARKLGREDPNQKIGVTLSGDGQSFMAIDDISFQVDRGDKMALIGRNGAGKSTILKLISRITAPTTGEIRVLGHVASLLEVGTGFHPELTGRENIYMNGAIMGLKKKEIDLHMDEIIEFSEISGFIDTPVKRYSSGMFVKLGFATAASLTPDILICDEVLAVGDLAFQQKCLAKMSDFSKSGGAVLYVSHNMRTVSQLCNRAVFLHQGKLLYDGTTEHAIDMYNGMGNRDSVKDLDAMPRPRKTRGVQMRMLKMQVLNSEKSEYRVDDEMEFDFTAVSYLDEKDVRLQIMVMNNMAAPIAMTQTPAFDVTKDEAFTINVAFPLHRLAPGEYSMKFSLVSTTIGSSYVIYDTIVDVGQFKVVDDNGDGSTANWSEGCYGSIRMEPLHIARI